MELDHSKSMSGHWGSSSCLRCPKCGKEEQVNDNIVFARGWGSPPVLPKCKSCAPKPKLSQPLTADLEARVDNLQERFPDRDRDEIRWVLNETKGHAGKAISLLNGGRV